jgi:hypothetical protein
MKKDPLEPVREELRERMKAAEKAFFVARDNGDLTGRVRTAAGWLEYREALRDVLDGPALRQEKKIED